MDPVLIDVYKQMAMRHHCSVDDILCDPDLRSEFLDACRGVIGKQYSEFDVLHRLSNLRKKSKLPRTRDLIAI